MQVLEDYQKEIIEIYKTNDFGEHSFRTPLQNLLNALSPSVQNVKILQEAPSKDEKGTARADFKVYKRIDPKNKLSYNALVGFVECKNINVDLKKELQSEQLRRYTQICPNILLTNYCQFILLSFGKVIKTCTLFDKDNHTLFKEDEKQVFLTLISDFFNENHANIKSKTELISALSTQSFYLSTALHDAYKEWREQKNAKNQNFFKFFERIYSEFTQLAQMNFNEFDFCDLIAQSVVYGLFVSFVENENFDFSENEVQNFIRTHRAMRESLFTSFDAIYILNLHGSSEKDAKEDENVFSIKVGVCISFFVKYKTTKSEGAKLYYYSTSEAGVFKRAEKFALLQDLAKEGLKSLAWKELSPEKPYFWFVPRVMEDTEYEGFWTLAQDKALTGGKAVFLDARSGMNTRNDNLLIQPSFSKIKEAVEDMQKLNEVDILKKYKIDTKSWKVEEQRVNFGNAKDEDFLKVTYRPFDTQYTFYPLDKISKIIPRGDSRQQLTRHFIKKENLGISFLKSCNENYFNFSFVSNKIMEGLMLKGRTYIAPLYLYDINGKTPNFTPEFLAYKAKHKILKDKNEEQILAFIYANLYNPKYRSKYLDYLKIGFPKVSFEVSVKEFERFEKLGSELIKLHLMQEIPHDEIDFEGECGEGLIEKRQESERFKEDAQKKGRIILNEKLSIVGVSREVWDYTIGGYQVIKQWLKYRKEQTLSREELLHLLKMCKILNETLQIQKALDEI